MSVQALSQLIRGSSPGNPRRTHRRCGAPTRRPHRRRLALEPLESRTLLAVFTVNSVDDTVDANPGDGFAQDTAGNTTLRAAIMEANACAGADTIEFNILGAGPHTIRPTSPLPGITDPVVIDGYTQPGASPNTNAIDQPINAVLQIELDGSLAKGVQPAATGIHLNTDNSTVRGLVINRFEGSGIVSHGSGNVFEGNFIGTDVTGTVALGNGFVGSPTGGIQLSGENDRVGGTAPEARNLISGNFNGVTIYWSSNNVVEGNFIGTDLTGTQGVANARRGIFTIGSTATGNTIGGTTPAARNVISGNEEAGISSYASGTLVQGNYIGTDRTGSAALANGIGVRLQSASNDTVGGTTPAERNIISGNSIGVSIRGGGTGNLIQGNFIGTDATGLAALKNGTGVEISFAPGNAIGGTQPGAGNLISGNVGNGIIIEGADATGNIVEGNWIGTDLSGAAPLGNGIGVRIASAPGNLIGGTTAAAQNVISGNLYTGVEIYTSYNIPGSATGNQVQGNYIGTDVSGTAALGNTGHGVSISHATDNVIGGTTPGARNVIAGNAGDGVMITGAEATGNLVQGNFIGTDVTGTAAIGNRRGVATSAGAVNNTIGGAATGAGNLISGNVGDGVTIVSDGNVVQGNLIGTDAAGSFALGNGNSGVTIYNAANCLIGGTAAAARNVISANGFAGVFIAHTAAATGNLVQGNFIGTDATGTAAIGNHYEGVRVDGPGNTIGGTAEGAGNLISGNSEAGVFLQHWGENVVQGNFIGTDVTATAVLGNRGAGVAVWNNAYNTTIGGTTPGARNIISGNAKGGVGIGGGTSSGNRVQGNFIGTDLTGTVDLGNGDTGVQLGGDSDHNLVGGTQPGAGNVISGNEGDGLEISVSGPGAVPAANVVQGNLIGTDVTGTVALGNSRDGVRINGAEDNTIGGTAAGAGNVISGNHRNGVVIAGTSATGNQVHGNLIGTDIAGTAPLGNAATGVLVSLTASANTNTAVGGTMAGAGNTIAFNGDDGVAVWCSPGVAIRGNSIHANAGLGIDLGYGEVPDAVTPNDPGDADSGANNLQNYPVLTSVAVGGGNTIIEGTLGSTPNTTFAIELFANSTADPSGHGEGETFLGTSTVTTDSSGNATFSINVPQVIPAGQLISATATDPEGNTSEFSGQYVVPPSAPDAKAGGPYAVTEGGSVVLDASGTTDPDQDPATLTYEWDLDCDEIFGETGAAAENGDETGIAPTFFAAGLDGNELAAVTVRLQVTDDSGQTSSDTATIEIANAAPTASISGPESGVRGQTRTLTLSATDPSAADQAAGFTFEIDFNGDGIVDETVAGPSVTTVSHVYSEAGTYTIKVTATDQDGATGTTASHGMAIQVVDQHVGPCGATVLAVGGTGQDDHIIFTPGADAGEITVKLNGESLGTFQHDGPLLAFGLSGDDNIQVAGSIGLPAWLYGGPGSDRLMGGAGHDVLFGQEGDDLLVGQSGRDLLIGGAGADRIVGNADDDILIAGYLTFDDVDEAICAVRREWLSEHEYQTRIENLSGTTHSGFNDGYFLVLGETVEDDTNDDKLTGSAGFDWFFFNQDNDRATDLSDEVFANDLDWILAG